jgi:hypothetical protein
MRPWQLWCCSPLRLFLCRLQEGKAYRQYESRCTCLLLQLSQVASSPVCMALNRTFRHAVAAGQKCCERSCSHQERLLQQRVRGWRLGPHACTRVEGCGRRLLYRALRPRCGKPTWWQPDTLHDARVPHRARLMRPLRLHAETRGRLAAYTHSSHTIAPNHDSSNFNRAALGSQGRGYLGCWWSAGSRSVARGPPPFLGVRREEGVTDEFLPDAVLPRGPLTRIPVPANDLPLQHGQ